MSCGVVNPDDRSTNLIDPVDGVMLHHVASMMFLLI